MKNKWKQRILCMIGPYSRLYRWYDIHIKKREYRWDEKIKLKNGIKNGRAIKQCEDRFIVFRLISRGGGIGSYLMAFLKWLSYWNKKEPDRIPVIDMKNYPSTYLEEKDLGTVNAWEFFYKQISDYSLEDVYASKDVILAGYMYQEWDEDQKRILAAVHGNEKEFRYWSGLYKKYFHLNEHISWMVREYAERFQMDVRRILGVKFRVTDYVYALAQGHAVQAGIDEMIQLTEAEMSEGGYDFVFLAVESEESREAFECVFGDRLLYCDTLLADYNSDKKNIPFGEQAARQLGRRKSGEEYLLEVIILSKCTALLASENSGSIMATIINDGRFENCHWINHGYNVEI